MSDTERLAQLEVVDATPWLAFLADRYGLPATTFADFLLVRPSNRRLHLVRRDLQLPTRPAPLAVGLPFLHINRRPPRLTTAAALRFGMGATRNTVQLRSEQIEPFLGSAPFPLLAVQHQHLDGAGHVIVRWQGQVLGLGFYRPRSQTVESELPKTWRRQRDAAQQSRGPQRATSQALRWDSLNEGGNRGAPTPTRGPDRGDDRADGHAGRRLRSSPYTTG